MLLILTGAVDGTSDYLLEKLGPKAFRFNFDIFNEYEIEMTPSRWLIKNPAGHEISSESATACLWWKVTNYRAHEDSFLNEEIKYIFREIYNWFYHRNLVRGNPPDYHNRNGKLHILSKAKNHFPIPETFIGWGFKKAPKLKANSIVAKSLSSGLTATNRALFTTTVDANKLHPDYPWYLQEAITADFDITVFICANKLYAFKRTRKNLKGLDWRAEQDFGKRDDWEVRTLSISEISAINSLSKDLGVSWGRMDFLEINQKLIFLEFNANGQWVFLDFENKTGIVDHVCEYLLSKPSD